MNEHENFIALCRELYISRSTCPFLFTSVSFLDLYQKLARRCCFRSCTFLLHGISQENDKHIGWAWRKPSGWKLKMGRTDIKRWGQHRTRFDDVFFFSRVTEETFVLCVTLYPNVDTHFWAFTAYPKLCDRDWLFLWGFDSTLRKHTAVRAIV